MKQWRSPPPQFRFWQDLALQLLVAYLVFMLPFLMAAVSADRLARERLQADVQAADLSLARAIAQETNITLGTILQAVQTLGKQPAVRDAVQPGMAEAFANFYLARPEASLIYRLDSQGEMRYHYPEGPGSTVGVNFAFRPYFQRARRSELPFLSLGRISPTTQEPVATAVMPLRNHDAFLGLVGVNIRLESLSWTLARIAEGHRLEEGFQVLIVDNGGQIIAHSEPGHLLQSFYLQMPHLVEAVLARQEGSLVYTGPDGVERLYSYVPIPSAGWGVVVSRTTASAFATTQAFHQGVVLGIAAFALLGALFWLTLTYLLLRPLEALARYSRQIGQSLPEKAASFAMVTGLAMRNDQIGHLARTLQRLEQDIRQRLSELHTLLETSAAVVSSLDLPTVLERILAEVERLLGIEKCAILVWDEKEGHFVARASRGLSPSYAARLVVSPDHPGSPTMRAMRTGHPVYITDTERDPSFVHLLPRARAEGYRALVVMPLKTQHAPPAALVAYYPEPHEFTEQELSILSSFANHAAMAIENAALYARSDMRLREQTHRLEALIQSLNEGLILEDLEGRVLYANRRITLVSELAHEDLLGTPVAQVVTRITRRATEPEKAQACLLSLLETHQEGACELSLRLGGHIEHYRVQVFQVTDLQGHFIGRGLIWQDVTADREVDRMKSSLISTVSHELRTPLASIKGYATSLLADDVQWDPETQREFLQHISEETDRLSQLINDLLDLSRIEGGALKVDRKPTDLLALVRRASHLVPDLKPERLIVEAPDDLLPVPVDARRIEVALRNLLENAVKYSLHPEDPITVSIQRQEDRVIVRVIDQGPGIPAEHAPHIFDSFYRAEPRANGSRSGVGLGLAIARGFIEAHGGRIWLEPRAQGTCIAFSLPLEVNDHGPTQ
ncbi:MAG TPA: GAF domain-containing protein [Anaerolineae bacterium]|nr:GAF domain-containing protein [Anaerolineae bacterium]